MPTSCAAKSLIHSHRQQEDGLSSNKGHEDDVSGLIFSSVCLCTRQDTSLISLFFSLRCRGCQERNTAVEGRDCSRGRSVTQERASDGRVHESAIPRSLPVHGTEARSPAWLRRHLNRVHAINNELGIVYRNFIVPCANIRSQSAKRFSRTTTMRHQITLFSYYHHRRHLPNVPSSIDAVKRNSTSCQTINFCVAVGNWFRTLSLVSPQVTVCQFRQIS